MRLIVGLTVSSQGRTVASVSGSGSFSIPAHAAAMTMRFSFPGAASGSPLSNLQLRMVLARSTIYMKLPPQLAAKLPGGKPWVEASLSQIGKAGGVPGLSSLLNSSSSLNNPGQYLAFLRATSKGSVRDLGPATVDGFQTTRYRATIDISKLPTAVPPAQRQAMQQVVAVLRREGGSVPFPIDVWIDSQHLVRRLELTYPLHLPSTPPGTEAVREDFPAYGPQPAPSIPPASQTTNLFGAGGRRP
jgi:hypothetical protein